MPNLVAPKGFVPSRYMNGSPYNGAVNMYVVLAAEVNQINVGDTVKSAANGDANGVPAVTKITNGTDTCRGVVVGILLTAPNSPSLVGTVLDNTLQYIPASKSKDYYILVADDPNILFLVEDDGLAALTATSCNKNASYTVANPTGVAQISATVLNTASVATTNTLPLKLMGLVQRPDNAFGINADWLVRFNTHEFAGSVAGV
jgi:hypothetical protein